MLNKKFNSLAEDELLWKKFIISPPVNFTAKIWFLKNPGLRCEPYLSNYFQSKSNLEDKKKQLQLYLQNGNLNSKKINILKKSPIQTLIFSGHLEIAIAAELNADQVNNLCNIALHPLIFCGKLDIYDAMNLPMDEKTNLCDISIHPLIIAGPLSIPTAKKLDNVSRNNLGDHRLHPLIINESLTVIQVMNLNPHQTFHLIEPEVQESLAKMSVEERAEFLDEINNKPIHRAYVKHTPTSSNIPR